MSFGSLKYKYDNLAPLQIKKESDKMPWIPFLTNRPIPVGDYGTGLL